MVIVRKQIQIDLVSAGLLGIYSFIQMKPIIVFAQVVLHQQVAAAIDQNYAMTAPLCRVACDIAQGTAAQADACILARHHITSQIISHGLSNCYSICVRGQFIGLDTII